MPNSVALILKSLFKIMVRSLMLGVQHLVCVRGGLTPVDLCKSIEFSLFSSVHYWLLHEKHSPCKEKSNSSKTDQETPFRICPFLKESA